MASVEIDGLIVPIAITDQPVLNFCNTRAGWGAPAPKEYLHTHAHLTIWARENGLVSTPAARALRRLSPDSAPAAAVVTRAVAFRSALYAVLLGRADRRDWSVVNAEVRAAAAAHELVPTTTGTAATKAPATHAPAAAIGWRVADPTAVDSPLWAVVWASAGLLTSPLSTQVAACPGVGCGWVFADPRGRRRWCSMAWCGNRNKARRHAERQRQTD